METLKNKKGQGLVEYLLIIAVVVIGVVAFVTMYNGSTDNIRDQVQTQLNTASETIAPTE